MKENTTLNLFVCTLSKKMELKFGYVMEESLVKTQESSGICFYLFKIQVSNVLPM